MTPGTEARATAARAVAAVMRGRSLDDALPAGADSFTRALAYGVLREQRLLAHLCGQLLDKPVTEDLRALLLCGLFQLRSMDIAAHAAVNETVNSAEALRQPKARGLVNAILRRYQRERAELDGALPDTPGLRHSHPDWLVAQIGRDWPQQASALLEANNRQAPMSLRVNARRSSVTAWMQGQPARKLGEHGVVLDAPCPVSELPGFAEGQVSVQDAAAQFAAALLETQEGQRVLDACAAPGGKTAHLLELHRVHMTALDSDAKRLQRVDDNLRRLGLSATLIAADAGVPERWWDGKPFDRILLDAPCSGSGVIRRHPDIKWLRRESDIPRMAAQQLRLLRALWPLLTPGGVLLYASCSVLRAEGDGVVADFRRETADAEPLGFRLPVGEQTAEGWRIAPGGDYDGFYYARLQKKRG